MNRITSQVDQADDMCESNDLTDWILEKRGRKVISGQGLLELELG